MGPRCSRGHTGAGRCQAGHIHRIGAGGSLVSRRPPSGASSTTMACKAWWLDAPLSSAAYLRTAGARRNVRHYQQTIAAPYNKTPGCRVRLGVLCVLGCILVSTRSADRARPCAGGSEDAASRSSTGSLPARRAPKWVVWGRTGRSPQKQALMWSFVLQAAACRLGLETFFKIFLQAIYLVKHDK